MAVVGTLLKRTTAGGVALLAGELLWAIARPVPAFEDLDASGQEGDSGNPPLRLAVLGDSSCTGPGLDDPAGIWVRVLARDLGDRFHVTVRSFAIGGSRAVDLVRSQLANAIEWGPDIALVSVGGNDALKGVSIGAFERHLTTVIAGLAATTPVVVLSGVGDLGSIPRLLPPLDRLFRARGLKLNEIHHRVGARHGVVVADQWRWAAQEFSRRPDLFSEDLFHPGPDGHRIWADVARETIEPHLARFIPGARGGSPIR
jgi:lysophospholipase L1-like esterase